MKAGSTSPAPGICQEKAQLESGYKRAKDAFDTARSVLRQKVGKSSRAEFLKLERATDLAWDRLEHAMGGFCYTYSDTRMWSTPRTDLVNMAFLWTTFCKPDSEAGTHGVLDGLSAGAICWFDYVLFLGTGRLAKR
jgi:hypothetical protein